MEFDIIKEYYHIYQEIYNNIASQLTNKNGHKD